MRWHLSPEIQQSKTPSLQNASTVSTQLFFDFCLFDYIMQDTSVFYTRVGEMFPDCQKASQEGSSPF